MARLLRCRLRLLHPSADTRTGIVPVRRPLPPGGIATALSTPAPRECSTGEGGVAGHTVGSRALQLLQGGRVPTCVSECPHCCPPVRAAARSGSSCTEDADGYGPACLVGGRVGGWRGGQFYTSPECLATGACPLSPPWGTHSLKPLPAPPVLRLTWAIGLVAAGHHSGCCKHMPPSPAGIDHPQAQWWPPSAGSCSPRARASALVPSATTATMRSCASKCAQQRFCNICSSFSGPQAPNQEALRPAAL